MRATIRIAVDANRIAVVDIENVGVLARALTDHAPAPDALERVKVRAERCVNRAAGIQERMFRQGIHRAEPLSPTLLDADAPGMAAALIAHADLEIFGEKLPASLLFQTAVPLNRGGERAEVALLVSVLEALVRNPFASDAELETALGTVYANVTRETVRALRSRMGIEPSVLRFDPISMLSIAVERVATARWLRERLRAHLQVERKLASVCVPWPPWWCVSHLVGELDGRVAYTHRSELRFIAEASFDLARGTWERFRDLGVPAREAKLEAALAELLARSAAGRAPDQYAEILMLMSAAIASDTFPEIVSDDDRTISGRDLHAMFIVAPPDEWAIVLERIGLDTDQLDGLLVDALAEGLSSRQTPSLVSAAGLLGQ